MDCRPSQGSAAGGEKGLTGRAGKIYSLARNFFEAAGALGIIQKFIKKFLEMYTLDMVSKRSKYNSFQYVTPKCIVYNGF